MSLSDYEDRAYERVKDRKEKDLNKTVRRIVPKSVKQYGRKVADKVQATPGADKVVDAGSAALATAAEGAGKFMLRTGQLTTSADRVANAYRKRGHVVTSISDIRALDLAEIDKVASFRRLQYTYAVTAATEGAATGLAVSGGQVAVAAGGVAGMGAGAAPGLGVVAGAAGVDIAAMLTACSRAVAHVALYYGYDPRDPAEEVFMMQVIGLGIAGTASGKAVAYQQLAVLTQKLARNATWAELNKHTLTKVVQKFAASFSQKMTKRKLGQFIPLAGVGIGAAMNYKMLDDVAEAAYWAYRERLLIDKGAVSNPVSVVVTDPSDADAIDVVALVEDSADVDDGSQTVTSPGGDLS